MMANGEVYLPTVVILKCVGIIFHYNFQAHQVQLAMEQQEMSNLHAIFSIPRVDKVDGLALLMNETHKECLPVHVGDA
jgi:hypothetical protein